MRETPSHNKGAVDAKGDSCAEKRWIEGVSGSTALAARRQRARIAVLILMQQRR